jgi:hypothetical protein
MMILSRGSRAITITIMIVLFILLLVCIPIGFVLREISFQAAQANQELQHMRIPVFIMGVTEIAIFAVNLVLAETLLCRILMSRIFTITSVRILKSIGWLFMAGLLPLISLFVYTELNVKSITQIYVILGAIIYLTAGLIFMLLANLISDASLYKQEVDLTV